MENLEKQSAKATLLEQIPPREGGRMIRKFRGETQLRRDTRRATGQREHEEHVEALPAAPGSTATALVGRFDRRSRA